MGGIKFPSIFATAWVITTDCSYSNAETSGKSSEKHILVVVNYFAGCWKELPNKCYGQGWKIGQPDWHPDHPELAAAMRKQWDF